MSTSSTVIFSMGSGERKRCSNMAPVRRLRSLAWMKARRLPGVLCSTLKTECRSLLCLIIMPGRSWVAGIDMRLTVSLRNGDHGAGRIGDEPLVRPARGSNYLVYTDLALLQSHPRSSQDSTVGRIPIRIE